MLGKIGLGDSADNARRARFSIRICMQNPWVQIFIDNEVDTNHFKFFFFFFSQQNNGQGTQKLLWCTLTLRHSHIRALCFFFFQRILLNATFFTACSTDYDQSVNMNCKRGHYTFSFVKGQILHYVSLRKHCPSFGRTAILSAWRKSSTHPPNSWKGQGGMLL